MTTRRNTLAGLAALGALAACGARPTAQAPARAAAPMLAAPNTGFDAWLVAFRPRALAAGLSSAVVDPALDAAGFLPGVVERDRNQTEFTRTLEDYLQIAASADRVANGRAALGRQRATLDQIEARYGVPSRVVTAIWGLESSYGARRGTIPVVSSTATLAYDGRRGRFFEQQLIAALRILQRGDTTVDRMVGSWAGAMGHTQFIPTSYEAHAVDFGGDGRRDIWADDPTDALASTANYLAEAGWRRGQPWGIEVVLPADLPAGLVGRERTESSGAWANRGLRPALGGALPDHGPASLLIPEGPQGPAFLVYRNFTVISRYNNAVSYVIGVGHLSDRIAGGPPIQGSFPPDAWGMTLDDRQRLQRRLTALGYDTEGADGVIGSRTREAIRAYQAAEGLPQTGEPSAELLARLL